MSVEVNYLAVLLAGIASMVVGFLWYGQMMFGKPWMKLMGYTKESMEKAKKNMAKTYTISFVLSLVTADVLWHAMTFSSSYFNMAPVSAGLMTAFWSWFGFMMPVQATEVLFGSKKWKLFGINTGYQLVSLFVMGIVMAMMM